MFRDSQQKGRLRLRHLLEETEAVGEEMERERPRFDRLASEDSKPRAVSAFNLFQTPETLADRAASMLTLRGRMLEPSAGLGRLYRAARYRSDCHITLVEIAPECCRELYRATEGDDACRLIQGDFLAYTGEQLGGPFDCILMNPPFKMGRDIKHIRHAASMLAPGGRLVAFCANGPRQREQLMGEASEWVELPPESFASEGTRVNAAIVVIDR